MANYDDVKATIMAEFEKMLDEGLTSLISNGPFSSSAIGRDIGKFINQEVSELRSSVGGKKTRSSVAKKQSDDDAEEKKHAKAAPTKTKKSSAKKATDDEVKEKPKRAPSAWNLYVKAKYAELKAADAEAGEKTNSKEMLSRIAAFWKIEQDDFKEKLKAQKEEEANELAMALENLGEDGEDQDE